MPCKPLIQKVKEDTSSVGLSGEQCMVEAQLYFDEMRKKHEASVLKKEERKKAALLK